MLAPIDPLHLSSSHHHCFSDNGNCGLGLKGSGDPLVGEEQKVSELNSDYLISRQPKHVLQTKNPGDDSLLFSVQAQNIIFILTNWKFQRIFENRSHFTDRQTIASGVLFTLFPNELDLLQYYIGVSENYYSNGGVCDEIPILNLLFRGQQQCPCIGGILHVLLRLRILSRIM